MLKNTNLLNVLDRHHFDNPVYQYQGSLRRDDDALILLNNTIRNDLGIKNNINLERQMFATAGCSEEDGKLKFILFHYSRSLVCKILKTFMLF